LAERDGAGLDGVPLSVAPRSIGAEAAGGPQPATGPSLKPSAPLFPLLTAEFADYLRDESRRTGRADTISFPVSEDEIRAHLQAAARAGAPVTIQGARTGIAAGAVPDGGHVLNLSRMNRILGVRRADDSADFLLTVEPGALLTEVRKALRHPLAMAQAAGDSAVAQAWTAFAKAGSHFFPTDPTETSASIGGMVACNASGARSFLFGAMRNFVQSLRVVLVDGSVLCLARGAPRAQGRAFSVRTDSGRAIAGRLPSYAMPAVKNASGYFARDDMDLLDLFIGAEGTLGVVSQVDLRLIRAPQAASGLMGFFGAEAPAVDFAETIRAHAPKPAAVEFFNCGALDLLRRQKEANPAFKELPAMPPEWHTAIYVEYFGDSSSAVDDAVARLADVLSDCGGDMDATWLAGTEPEIERLKDFRHAVPEAVNLLIDQRRKREPGLTKLGTDLAVPDGRLQEMLALYRADLDCAGLEHVMFGHIGNNHIHVNIIPNTMAEYEKGKALYLGWAQAVVGMGGTVSAEHGIGKLKPALLKTMYSAQGIQEMREVKRLFDPEERLNRGNLFEAA
jgi:D-lactate dehydrogenase (cytochrome)